MEYRNVLNDPASLSEMLRLTGAAGMCRSCWRRGRRPSATAELEGSDGRPVADRSGSVVERVSIQQRRTHTMQFSEDALKFLNLGINSEIAAYVFYKHAGAIVKEKGSRIPSTVSANDEKGHFLSLEDLYDRNVRSEMWAPYKDILGKEGLPDIDDFPCRTRTRSSLAQIRGSRRSVRCWRWRWCWRRRRSPSSARHRRR